MRPNTQPDAARRIASVLPLLTSKARRWHRRLHAHAGGHRIIGARREALVAVVVHGRRRARHPRSGLRV